MLEPVFNDLSATPPAPDLVRAFERMALLVELLRLATVHGLDTGLRIPQTFHALEIAPGYRVWDWLNDQRVPREHSGFLLTLATRSPYLDQAPEALQERAELVDVRVCGVGSDALRAAYLLDAPLLSFMQAPWDRPYIDCEYQELVDDTVTSPRPVQVPNLAQVPHFGIHADWIRKRRRRSIESPQDFWTRRNAIFPHLEFCASVGPQFLAMRQSEPRFQQSVNKLFDLEDYFGGWNFGGFDPGAFPKCNPVSPETLAAYPHDYRFLTPDGREVIASWHLYLTPGKGRLYFEADSTRRRGIVCHVGDKLPDTTYGRT